MTTLNAAEHAGTAGATPEDVVRDILAYIKAQSRGAYGYVAQEQFERLYYSARYIESRCRKSDAILDIGSHPYFVPAYLSLRGFENVLTVEIPRRDDYARSPSWKFRSITLDIEESRFPLPDDSLDLVVLFEVFEHLYRRPNQVFREICRILKPGGRVMISTPNGARLSSYARAVFRQQFGGSLHEASACFESSGIYTHLREYSLAELRDYLGHFDLVVEEVKFQSFRHLEYPYENALAKGFDLAFSWIKKRLTAIHIIQTNIFIVARCTKKPAA